MINNHPFSYGKSIRTILPKYMLAIPWIFLFFTGSFSLIEISEWFAYGHGVGEETLPPVRAGNKNVTLAILSSSTSSTSSSGQAVLPTQIPLSLDNDKNTQIIGKDKDKEIRIRLFESDSGLSARSVTFVVTAYKAEETLFEKKEIKSDNGVVNFVFRQGNNIGEQPKVTVKEKAEPSFLQSIISYIISLFVGNSASSDSAGKTVMVHGPRLSYGGLYSFDIDIKTIGSYSNELDTPAEYRNVAVSVPTIQLYKIDDQGYLDDSEGIGMVSFFDVVKEFEYNSKENQVRFSFPFDWSEDNIEQITVVHEELVVPKKFTPLLSKNFVVTVNGYELPQSAITIDDFPEDRRVIHFIVTKPILEEIKKNQIVNTESDQLLSKSSNKPSADELGNSESSSNVIEFKVNAADSEFLPVSTITKNGKYRIDLEWKPQQMTRGESTELRFTFYDTFLKDKIVSENYDLRLHDKNGKEYFVTQGKSSKQKMETVVEIPISKGENTPTHGVYLLTFENIGGNDHATATFYLSTQ